MFNISSSFKNLEGMLMMLALLCCFAKEAISSLQQIAALIPFVFVCGHCCSVSTPANNNPNFCFFIFNFY
jgi:hypothetical protein